MASSEVDNKDNKITITSDHEEANGLREWPFLAGVSDLDIQDDQTHWTEYQCPDELKHIESNATRELRRILVRSLAVNLYTQAQTENVSSANSETTGDLESVRTRAVTTRTRTDSESVVSRLSTVPSSDGSQSPSKISLDSSSIKRPLTKLAVKSSSKAQGIKLRMKDQHTAKECASCLEDILEKNLMTLKCQHKYCLPCFIQLITTAMENERLFPPKCCLQEIPMSYILDNLDRTQKANYKLKTQEYAIPQDRRWYCHSPSCGKWIPPNKLKKNSSVQKCPHCKSPICSLCRGKTHQNANECPRDYGLESTLEEAEMHGWRRCYSCRAMVELTVGCRHITCTCGAQFCYTCGARWRTCDCTEADQQRRQEEINARRLRLNEEAAREAAELTEALAIIERMEEEETRERIRREEEERLREEEQRRREEEEAREREIERTMKIAEKVGALRNGVLESNKSQQYMLIARHESQAYDLQSLAASTLAQMDGERSRLKAAFQSNLRRRMDLLTRSHDAEIQDLTAKHEEEEDDTFLSLARHLKGKPNREGREKSIMDRLKASQDTEVAALKETHKTAKESLESKAALEAQALELGIDIQQRETKERQRDALYAFAKLVIAERSWFDAASQKRLQMVEQYRDSLMNDREEPEDPAPEVVPETIEPVFPDHDIKGKAPIPQDEHPALRGTLRQAPKSSAKPDRAKRFARQSPYMALMG